MFSLDFPRSSIENSLTKCTREKGVKLNEERGEREGRGGLRERGGGDGGEARGSGRRWGGEGGRGGGGRSGGEGGERGRGGGGKGGKDWGDWEGGGKGGWGEGGGGGGRGGGGGERGGGREGEGGMVRKFGNFRGNGASELIVVQLSVKMIV
ncbi:unnamed protein product [Closterium sp. NIES-65]|nr:unnamed protein product [Closterium sp. NIES-65]